MRGKVKWLLIMVLALALALPALSGCGQEAAPEPLVGTAENDILTFIPNLDNRPIIHIGTVYYTPDTSFVDALQEAFPEYLFVLDQGLSAGVDSGERIFSRIDQGEYYDLLITGDPKPVITGSPNTKTTEEEVALVDLSAESFLNNYLLSSLNSVSLNGHIYSIPGTSTLSGIAFNVDMFQEHGWEIPQTHEEFFALCQEIQAAGISPYSTNFKYSSQVARVMTMMCYAELFETPEGAEWISKLPTAQAKFEGYAEPMFEVIKQLADLNIITADNFTASLTQQRQDFWAGQHAMIDYDSTIYTYAEDENAPFELGIMPYPAREAEHAGFAVTPEYYISIPDCVEQDPERLALMKDILAFISTEPGQEAMLKNSLRISSVKNVALTSTPATKYAEEAYYRGNLYPNVGFNAPGVGYFSLLQETALMLVEGSSVEEAVKYFDSAVAAGYAAGPSEEAAKEYEVIAQAEERLTMLETSYYIADKLREASGADIGLMINGGFFRSNLSSIPAGDITADMSAFVMKGVGAEDWLTTYSLTGAQLKQLIEHPLVNGAEIDALIAASGLAIEYAPWNERGSRVLSLTLADGSELADDQLYTVAAWAGVIDGQYITDTLTVHDSLGTLTDILLKAFQQDGSIKPDIAGRVTLVWPEPGR